MRDVRKLRDRQLSTSLEGVIEQVEAAGKLADISDLKKLKHRGGYFRIKVGEYRCGLQIEGNMVTLVRLLHRKDIYRYFPNS